MQSIGIKTLKRHKDGTIQVFTTKKTIDGVPENLVRCALGENDMDYLLRIKGVDNSHVFGITQSEYDDFIKYSKS